MTWLLWIDFSIALFALGFVAWVYWRHRNAEEVLDYNHEVISEEVRKILADQRKAAADAIPPVIKIHGAVDPEHQKVVEAAWKDGFALFERDEHGNLVRMDKKED